MRISASGLISAQDISHHNHTDTGELEFHYFLHGRGQFRNDGQVLPIGPGSLLFSTPQEYHDASASPEMPMVFIFVRFMKDSADQDFAELIEKLFGSRSRLDIGKGFGLAFEDIRLKSQSRDPMFRRSAEHRLCSLLYDLAAGQAPLPPRSQAYVNEALAMMQGNLHGRLNLDNLTERLGIDRSYFIRIFRQAVGSSPMKYYLGLKVDAARFLLLETDQPLARIAQSLGFRDEYHFSHSVKQATGHSPSAIRKHQARS